MKNIVVLENIRSAYNVGNIIRTADALGYDVVLSGFSPSPFDDEKVRKTSLGAEESVHIQQFWNPREVLEILREKRYVLIAAEVVEGKSHDLSYFSGGGELIGKEKNIALVFGNENTGVLEETLEYVNHIVHIPMQGEKESLNVGQAAAIFMWEIANMKRLKN